MGDPTRVGVRGASDEPRWSRSDVGKWVKHQRDARRSEGNEWVQSLSACGMAAVAAPVKPGTSRSYLRLDPHFVTRTDHGGGWVVTGVPASGPRGTRAPPGSPVGRPPCGPGRDRAYARRHRSLLVADDCSRRRARRPAAKHPSEMELPVTQPFLPRQRRRAGLRNSGTGGHEEVLGRWDGRLRRRGPETVLSRLWVPAVASESSACLPRVHDRTPGRVTPLGEGSARVTPGMTTRSVQRASCPRHERVARHPLIVYERSLGS